LQESRPRRGLRTTVRYGRAAWTGMPPMLSPPTSPAPAR